jgi:hypothetical protein
LSAAFGSEYQQSVSTDHKTITQVNMTTDRMGNIWIFKLSAQGIISPRTSG